MVLSSEGGVGWGFSKNDQTGIALGPRRQTDCDANALRFQTSGRRERYGVNGFVNLTFRGPTLSAEYQDLDGTQVLGEEWTVDGGGAIRLVSKQKLTNDPCFHA